MPDSGKRKLDVMIAQQNDQTMAACEKAAERIEKRRSLRAIVVNMAAAWLPVRNEPRRRRRLSAVLREKIDDVSVDHELGADWTWEEKAASRSTNAAAASA